MMPQVLIKKLIERGATFHDCDPLCLTSGQKVKASFITPADSMSPAKTFIGYVYKNGEGNWYLNCRTEVLDD